MHSQVAEHPFRPAAGLRRSSRASSSALGDAMWARLLRQDPLGRSDRHVGRDCGGAGVQSRSSRRRQPLPRLADSAKGMIADRDYACARHGAEFIAMQDASNGSASSRVVQSGCTSRGRQPYIRAAHAPFGARVGFRGRHGTRSHDRTAAACGHARSRQLPVARTASTGLQRRSGVTRRELSAHVSPRALERGLRVMDATALRSSGDRHAELRPVTSTTSPTSAGCSPVTGSVRWSRRAPHASAAGE